MLYCIEMSELESGQQYLRSYNAMALQRRADRLTAIREKHSRKAGIAVAALPRNWVTAAGGMYLAWTDWRDGNLAKKAQAELGVKEPLTDGHIKDPIADKTFRRELSRGIFARAILERDLETIAIMAGKHIVDKSRDKRMADHRALAAENKISVAAIQINRVKTATEMAGELLLISPFSNNKTVRRTALAMMAISTGIGLIGEHQYGEIVKSQVEHLTQSSNPLDAAEAPVAIAS